MCQIKDKHTCSHIIFIRILGINIIIPIFQKGKLRPKVNKRLMIPDQIQ